GRKLLGKLGQAPARKRRRILHSTHGEPAVAVGHDGHLVASAGELLPRERGPLRRAESLRERGEAVFVDEVDRDRFLAAVRLDQFVPVHGLPLARSRAVWEGGAMMRSIWALTRVGTLAACNPDTAGDATDPAAPAAPSPTPTETETVESSGARSVAEETDDFLFEYSYPAEAGRIVELASLLDVDLAEQREDLAADAAAARRAARDEGFPYNKVSYSAEWKVVSDLPGWLSMSAEVATYTGGAHGNQTIRSLVWDKEAERSVDAIALFTSPAALGEALGDRFCDRLDQERAKRRGAPVPEDSDDEF